MSNPDSYIIPKPIVCGHRGYKAKFPENTIAAFENAIANGAKVIETDLHISKDGYIVIAHDVTTLRVFGEDYDVTKTDYYPTLAGLRTLAEPRSPMPLFSDVLKWLWELEDKNIKLMLDIKRDNDPKRIIEMIIEEMSKISPLETWKPRIIFAFWGPEYFDESIRDFEICNVTVDTQIAEAFIRTLKEKHNYDLKYVSMVNFSIFDWYTLRKLQRMGEQYDLKYWFWPVNEPKLVSRSYHLLQDRLVGFITDDPPTISSYINAGKFIYPPLLTWGDSFKFFTKSFIYNSFLFFMRRKFNMAPVFTMLHKVGFI